MALINPSSLYSGGNVALDSSDSVDLYEKLLAKKQAKDEALNQFFEKELSSLSPTGVREVHKPGIIQGIDTLKKQWIQNKDRIMKDPNTRMEFDRGVQELAYKIDRAKVRDKLLFEIGKGISEGKYEKDDDAIKVLDKISRSVFDPESYKEDGVSDYDFNDFSPAIPEFDADRQLKFWKGVTDNIEPGKKYDYSKQYVNKSTGQVVVPFVEGFEDKQIEGIAENARKFAESDPSAKKYYKNLLNSPSRENFDRLQKAYSKYFQGIVDTPGKAAAADAILRASIKKESEEQEKQSKPAVIKNYMGGGGGSKKPTGGDLYDYDILGEYDGKAVSYSPKVKNGIWGYKKGEPISVVPAKNIDVKDKALIGVEPYIDDTGFEYYIKKEDGDWEGVEGQVISWAKVAQANMDKTALNEERRGRTELRADKRKGAPVKQQSQSTKKGELD